MSESFLLGSAMLSGGSDLALFRVNLVTYEVKDLFGSSSNFSLLTKKPPGRELPASVYVGDRFGGIWL